MESSSAELGVVGLGVMGRNLAYNIAGHGYAVTGFDKDADKVKIFCQEAEDRPISCADDWESFAKQLRAPRTLLLLVPAGQAVDSVIRDALPHLSPGDLIIDGGNSFFHDTDLRERTLAERKVDFIGMGVSGGEYGALHGPSMMPGGPKDAFERIRPVLEAASAHVDGEPCIAYLGPRSAGHYVKMVHNGIEYGLMQLISETYDLLRRGLRLSDSQLQTIYGNWNQTELNSYLLEITSNIFGESDDTGDARLIDKILDSAKQKGTGKWTSQDAMELGVPTPTIDAAVAMRNMSVLKIDREAASEVLRGPAASYSGAHEEFVESLRRALYASMIVTFTQGMAQLHAASEAYDYGLSLQTIAKIWRGGCIIRAELLEEIRQAYETRSDLPSLLLHDPLRNKVTAYEDDLRFVVGQGVALGIPVAALSASLAYFDAYRSAWLPANLIQAQRDYFGAHTYERIDEKGDFHTQWEHPDAGVSVVTHA